MGKSEKKAVMVIYVTAGKEKRIKRSLMDLKETLTYWSEAGSLRKKNASKLWHITEIISHLFYLACIIIESTFQKFTTCNTDSMMLLFLF